MADVRIKDLGTEATSLNTSDFLVTDTTAETKKISPANLANDLHKKAVTNATAKTTLLSTDNILVDESGTTKKIAGNYFAKTDNWGNPKGGAKLDGVDDYYSVADNDNLDFGTGDFSVAIPFNSEGGASNRQLLYKSIGDDIGGSTAGFAITAMETGALRFAVSDGTTFKLEIGAVTDYTFNKDNFLVITFNRTSGIATTFINGVKLRETDISTVTGSISNIYNLRIGHSNSGSYKYKGKIYKPLLFNRALTQAEVTKLYNNGRPDLAELDYADKGASQTALTSGTLVIGKRYKIDTFVAGDDFTNVATVESGTINTTGCVFICKATTPTTWTNSSSLRSLGCVFEVKGDGFGRIGLIDSSGNGLHGTSSGSPIALATEQGLDVVRDVKTLVTGNTTLTSVVPKGYILKQIIVNNTTAIAYTLNVGSATSGGTDVVNASSIGASGFTTITVNKTFSATAAQTLYLQSGAWNSSSSTYYLIMERVSR